MTPFLQRLKQLSRMTFRGCFGAPTAVASLIQRLSLESTFYLVVYSRGMFLFEQKFSGIDSSLETFV